MSQPDPMSARERSVLLSLIRKKERAVVAAAAKRGVEHLADFDRQLRTMYAFNNDDVRKADFIKVCEVVKEAQAKIVEQARELGIPNEFAFKISIVGDGCGPRAVEEQLAELRRMASSNIEAQLTGAATAAECWGLEAQTKVITDDLTNEDIKNLLAEVPSFEALMSPLDAVALKNLLANRD